jgi:hypothetical protein
MKQELINFLNLTGDWTQNFTTTMNIDGTELDGFTGTEAVINFLVNGIIYIGAAAVTVSFIGAAILYATSTGDPKKADRAKKWMTYGAIAIFCVILAVGGQSFVENVLKSEPGSSNSCEQNPDLPQCAE